MKRKYTTTVNATYCGHCPHSFGLFKLHCRTCICFHKQVHCYSEGDKLVRSILIHIEKLWFDYVTLSALFDTTVPHKWEQVYTGSNSSQPFRNRILAPSNRLNWVEIYISGNGNPQFSKRSVLKISRCWTYPDGHDYYTMHHYILLCTVYFITNYQLISLITLTQYI